MKQTDYRGKFKSNEQQSSVRVYLPPHLKILIWNPAHHSTNSYGDKGKEFKPLYGAYVFLKNPRYAMERIKAMILPI